MTTVRRRLLHLLGSDKTKKSKSIIEKDDEDTFGNSKCFVDCVWFLSLFLGRYEVMGQYKQTPSVCNLDTRSYL